MKGTRTRIALVTFLAACGSMACAGDETELPAGTVVVSPDGPLPPATEAAETQVAGESTAGIPAGDEALPAAAPAADPTARSAAEIPAEEPATAELPAVHAPGPAGPTALLVGAAGGELASGGLRAVVPGLDEELEVTLRPLELAELREPRPLSVVLAAAELTPANTITDDMMQLTFPLDRPVEPGTMLQLLSFSRSMDAFSVVDRNRAGEDGTVTFRTDVMSQYAVIAEPELRETSCLGGPLRLFEAEPERDEVGIVGRVERDDRMSPEVAAAVLTDMRYLPGSENIAFKDEERLQGTDEAPGPHEGEDFLVDPRLAQPLIELGQGVLSQWVDPIGGGPAFQLRVTDAYDGQIEHSATSNHYRGLAIDLTLSPVPAASRDVRTEYYGWLARQAVCAGFDYVHFENRFHVHVSSRGARLAWVELGPDGWALVLSRIDGTRRQTLHRELGLDLAGRDLRTLRFGPTGRTLELIGHHKGVPEAWRIDLDRLAAAPLPFPNPPPPRTQLVAVDPSLRFERVGRRLALARPRAEEGGRGAWRADLAPFPLTEEAVRGIVSAAWTSADAAVETATVGELTNERQR